MPKLLPRKRIAQVYFDKRNLNREERITQRNTGVGERSWIQDNEVDTIGGGFLHPIDEFVFGIALKAIHLMSKLNRDFNAVCFDVFEARRAIDLRFP